MKSKIFFGAILYLLFSQLIGCGSQDREKSDNHDAAKVANETFPIPEFEIVRVDDVSHGAAERISIVTLTSPELTRDEMRGVIQTITQKYKLHYDIVWVTLLPNKVIKESLLDSRQTLLGSDYYITMAQSLYVHPSKEGWHPGSIGIDEILGNIEISWMASDYIYEK